MSSKRRQSVSIQEETAFKATFDELLEKVVWHPSHKRADVGDTFFEMVNYNVPRGEQLRGQGLISAYKAFKGDVVIKGEELKQVYVLAWCLELLSATFAVPEDIIKNSLTRRGRLCWYLCGQVGKSAVNDAFILHSLMFWFLDEHFKGTPNHRELLKLFHKGFLNYTLGTKLGFCKGLESFTMDRYNQICKYRVGYVQFYMPMAVAGIMAGQWSPTTPTAKLMEEITLEMGALYQIQDDYLDCFGNPAVTGRYGTTVKGNCISWFIIKAIQRMSKSQEKVLRDCYGGGLNSHVHRVIKIFRDLDLVEEYRQFEREKYDEIKGRIEGLPDGFPKGYLIETLDLIVNRKK